MTVQPRLSTTLAISAVAAFFLSIVSTDARTWTNTKGQKVEAELIEFDDSAVVLKISSSGKNHRMPLNDLSDDDKAFVKKWLEEKTASGSDKKEPVGKFENWEDDWPALISTELDIEIEVVKEGKKIEEALDYLLDGRTWDELEKEITDTWRGRGIKFNFG